ncbi:unnamed protein product [Vitrella brassicaformis CCMP3155]|uniref:Uncharacterized protein n=1 Tax=Vitrella brassicaformis (strain CCMP3155) TaxID=1169540 RepID=A0A0G4E9T5_VITBC|nr:unnamed protein product [Vitrella brassicaformis CCMP3155]|eukprot:CEL92199.1 unnamed protein product [Vitrella brassicaformis CCMP3155]
MIHIRVAHLGEEGTGKKLTGKRKLGETQAHTGGGAGDGAAAAAAEGGAADEANLPGLQQAESPFAQPQQLLLLQ